jgi:hypothetical protein
LLKLRAQDIYGSVVGTKHKWVELHPCQPAIQ